MIKRERCPQHLLKQNTFVSEESVQEKICEREVKTDLVSASGTSGEMYSPARVKVEQQ